MTGVVEGTNLLTSSHILQLGWRSNLSTSKSIGDLHSLKDGDSFERSFSELKSRDDSIRRTSSMTDISFSSRRRLLPTFPNSPGGSGTGTGKQRNVPRVVFLTLGAPTPKLMVRLFLDGLRDCFLWKDP